VIPVVDRVKHEFDPGGDAEFVEDPEEVFLHGVLAQSQFLGDLSIGEALGKQCYNLLLPRSHQGDSVRVYYSQ
jgi:hypothetical protein